MVDCERAPRPRGAAVREAGGGPIRVCLDVDAGWWPLRRPHPDRRPALARAHARAGGGARARGASRGEELRLDGLMSYEAHIAGVGDRPPGRPLMGAAIRAMQRASARELARAPRRGGGRGARGRAAALRQRRRHGLGRAHARPRPAVTEVAAGSGLYGPTLFDAYARLRPEPAALFALPVVRRPDDAHGDAARRRLPGLGRGGRGPPAARRAPAGAAARPRRRAPARSRRRCAARAPPGCGSATACGCATRRRASCVSGSTRCTWCAAGRWWTTVPTYRGEGEAFL